MNNEDTHNDLYTKWLKNELSDKELQELKQRGDLAVLEKIMSETNSWSLPAPKKSFRDFKSQMEASKTKKKSLLSSGVFKIAASLVLLITLSLFIKQQFFDITTYQTFANETKSITLPDGSTVVMNANSTIEFNASDWENERVIELEGQAYFDVKKNPQNFIVNFSGSSVRVLGTQFDIFSFNNNIIVNCFEGKVQATINGNTAILTKNKGVKLINTTYEAFDFKNNTPLWNKDYIDFEQVTLTEILDGLSLKYNVQFENINNTIRSKVFTGRMSNLDLDNALEMVLTPLSISYTKNGNTIILQNQ